jgi:hypothetical protein
LIKAFKLFRLRKDGTLGPLFIGQKIRVPVKKWVRARPIHKKGFKFRPGWHACSTQSAPHLSMTGRVWCRVSLRGIQRHERPQSQGGLWYVARQLRVEEIL